MMITRRVPAAMAIVALSLLTVGCNDDEPSADPSTTEGTLPTTPPSTASVTTEPTTATSTTTTTTTAVPTTPPRTAGPTTAPPIAENDWPAILTELSRRRVSLYAAPDLARIGEYCMPATDCAAQLEAQLGDFITRGERIEGQQPFTIVDIENVLEGDQSPLGTLTDIVFIIGPTASPPPRIVDASGNVVEELTGSTTNTRVVFQIVKWDDPALPWRVFKTETLGVA